MTKTFFGSSISEYLNKEVQMQKAFEQVEGIISDTARHHRNPDAYNQDFLRRYNRLKPVVIS